MFRSLAIVGLSLSVVACSGSSSSPTANTPPPIPNYGGTWTGQYAVTSCNQSGIVAIANLCGNFTGTLPYRVILAESGRGVTGQFFLGTLEFDNVSSTIGADGSLVFAGSNFVNTPITIAVTWTVNLPAATQLTGTLSQAWQSTTLAGQGMVVGTLAGGGAHTASEGRALVSARPRSLDELLRAVHVAP